MKKELTPKDKDALAYIFDLPQYPVLKKYMENERFNIATKLLLLDPNATAAIAHLQGQAAVLKLLHQRLREIHKTQDKIES